MSFQPTCPSEPDDTAEEYVMLKLSTQEAKSYRTHIAKCEPCSQRVAFFEEYVDAMRAAANSFEDQGIARAPMAKSAAN
jgi:anti-sigma factor RsiW